MHSGGGGFRGCYMTALRLHILPSPLYIESIWRNDVCIERILLHVILHNRERAAVRVKKVEIAFMNAETNSTLVHRFEGQSLEAMLTRSAAMVPNSSGAGAAIAPDEMAGISGYYLELDGEHSFSEVQCAVSAVNEGGTAFQQTHKTRLCRNLPLVQLSLPLKGRWWVAGGHSPVEPHRRGKLQASTYAYDFVRIGADCRTY